MAVVTLDQVKSQLNVTGTIDDTLLTRKIAAAQDYVEMMLGFKLEERYPPTGSPLTSTVPASLVECVLQLASHWYENREAALVGVNAQHLPFGVRDIIADYRDYNFGEEPTNA